MRFSGLAVAVFLAAAVLATLPAKVDAAIPAGSAAPPHPGTARVWFMRPSDYSTGNAAASPAVYVNGLSLGALPAGTDFYRDLPPGNYRFTVEPYGLPTDQATVLQLAPGTETFLQVQWAGSWEFGQAPRGWSYQPNTFVVIPMTPPLAQAYLPTLRFTGPR